MSSSFTNLDALYLQNLADIVAEEVRLHVAHEGMFNGMTPNEVEAAFRRIAANLQRLDERNAFLENLPSASGGYAEGYAAAKREMRKRSNVLANPEGEDEKGAAILAKIEQHATRVPVKRIPVGERALDDKPHLFNGPRKAPKKVSPSTKELAQSLDLSFLGDF